MNSSLRWFRYDPWAFFIQSVFYSRSGFHAGMPLNEQVSTLTSVPSRILWLAGLPAGFALYLAERNGLAHLLPGRRQRRRALAWLRRTLG